MHPASRTAATLRTILAIYYRLIRLGERPLLRRVVRESVRVPPAAMSREGCPRAPVLRMVSYWIVCLISEGLR
jgi:hypothetical protein